MRSSLRVLVALTVMTSGCSLIDLDSLQHGDASGGATSSSSSVTSTSASMSTTTTSSTTTSGSSASSSSSSATGGCMDAFCDLAGGVEACADFDSDAHTLGSGSGWDAAISLSGATTGTVQTVGDDYTSCPTSAVVDIVGAAGDRSWVQVAHAVELAGKSKATFAARVKRSGPNGTPDDGAGLFEGYFDTGATTYCQVYVQLYDAPVGMTSGSYFFVQYWDGTQTVQLGSANIDLPAPTANEWASIQVAVDWKPSGQVVTTTINGVAKSIPLPSECGQLPSSITGAFGVSYEDETQTIRLDDLTARSE